MRRPIVQIPWAVNALGAAHSLPGETPCQHLLPSLEVQAMKHVFFDSQGLSYEGHMAGEAAMLKEKISAADISHAPARHAKRGSEAGCSSHGRNIPMHYHAVE